MRQKRQACPHRLRVVHAAHLSFTAVVVTLPIVLWMIGLTFREALMVEIGHSLVCAIHAFLFFLGL
jgi:uncharacterized membrane protein